MSATIPPEQPQADDKDWTWVTQRACTECGFDPAAVTPEAYPEQITTLSERFRVVLDLPDAEERPSPQVWSAIEYGQHLADVCEVMAQRLDAILEADGLAEFDSWDGEAASVEREYWRASANSFAAPSGDQWQLRGRRGDGVEFTASTLGLYLLHELAHHTHDVGA
ncbi:DinB family protein [Tessaracoccus flavescens]|uniref:DinB-like domain-containing protein n=1 Tax=Tessaracoccus flavescens TaxID=399497 RepID=A0A1Q2CYU1_9ACTN|nr:DinB family protein [Tessaracoccus flavescens]AQP51181.1 hypothetical protein BW733_10410 [Tessaracoccus flavescens]